MITYPTALSVDGHRISGIHRIILRRAKRKRLSSYKNLAHVVHDVPSFFTAPSFAFCFASFWIVGSDVGLRGGVWSTLWYYFAFHCETHRKFNVNNGAKNEKKLP